MRGREELTARFMELVARLGLSPDNPEDGWKVAVWLFMEQCAPRQPGRKAETRTMLEDAVMLAGLDHARKTGDRRSEEDIIRDLAKWNEWSTKPRTLWRRYQDLKRKGHPRRVRVIRKLQAGLEKDGLWPPKHTVSMRK